MNIVMNNRFSCTEQFRLFYRLILRSAPIQELFMLKMSLILNSSVLWKVSDWMQMIIISTKSSTQDRYQFLGRMRWIVFEIFLTVGFINFAFDKHCLLNTEMINNQRPSDDWDRVLCGTERNLSANRRACSWLESRIQARYCAIEIESKPESWILLTIIQTQGWYNNSAYSLFLGAPYY